MDPGPTLSTPGLGLGRNNGLGTYIRIHSLQPNVHIRLRHWCLCNIYTESIGQCAPRPVPVHFYFRIEKNCTIRRGKSTAVFAPLSELVSVGSSEKCEYDRRKLESFSVIDIHASHNGGQY